MKTKIIYISGTEIFDMADIRAAFEEVRLTLNLDKETVLFGVPVDSDDAGLTSNKSEPVVEEYTEPTKEEFSVIDQEETYIPEITPIIAKEEPIVEEASAKKRGRPRKQIIEEEETTIEKPVTSPIQEEVIEEITEDNLDEKIIPILSVLSSDEETAQEEEKEEVVEPIQDEEIQIVPDEEETSTEEIIDDIINEDLANLPDDPEEEISEENEEADLEKLLSGITPLGEDNSTNISDKEPEEPENVDATLEQLATEYVKNQDKITTESKNASRSKISTLRNILPFKPLKQKAQKDYNSGDLFSWGGIAANDEEFSVPGFFTKKSK